MSSIAIEVRDLKKNYRLGLIRKEIVEALKGVSFTVEKGAIFGLLGPNGAGKTTLIKILLGLVYKTSGQAFLMGRPAGDRVGRKEVGYLPENHRIPQHLTGHTALEYYGGLSGLSKTEVHHRRGRLLQRVNLAKWGNVSVKKYSKGMLQRLGIAQAILHDPQVLILDEPTDGVDPVGRSEIRQLLDELRSEGKTIFINSHLLQEIELICDRVAILVEGTVREVGLVENITQRRQKPMEFVLKGNHDLIEASFDAIDSRTSEQGQDGLVRVALHTDNQELVNRCIDTLRDNQIDILSIARARDSLEDAFLDIVTSSPPPIIR